MELHEWINSELSQDIWNKKYKYGEETFCEWVQRISNGNEELANEIVAKRFLFGGRILSNRGLHKSGRKITYSNCYVMTPPEDNIEDIFEVAKKLARTYSYGGGCGLSIGKLAPNGAKVNNAARTTTGSISFMDLYSMVTGLIGQNGRRGALMISIPCSHPDLPEFIDIKNDLDKITKANISVEISNDFMRAVKDNKDWEMKFRREETDQEIVRTVNARDLFKRIAKNNWEMAEPGALFWDRIKSWNFLSEDQNFTYAGVNPCAEEPLPPGGSCLLGSINLSEFIKDPYTPNAGFDLGALSKTVRIAVRALNEVLDEGLSLHPLQEQKDSVTNWRQIGLGIMGLADMLIKLGVRYGSDEAIETADIISSLIINEAVLASAELAKEHGSYPMFNYKAISKSEFFKNNLSDVAKDAVKKYGLRNSQLLTIAPTGTLSTMLGISGGIEPIFDISYTRKTESLHGEDKYYKVYTPIVKEYMDINNISNEADLPNFFVTSATLDYKERINMQAVFQSNIDASISSTVNVPESFTTEETEDLYMYAWEKGLKGVTIFRENCKRTAILTTGTKELEEEFPEVVLNSVSPISRSTIGKTYGCTVEGRSACGKMFITINRDKDGNIVESFINVSKSGMCKSNIDGINRMVSLAMRSGVKIEEIVDQLKGIDCRACTRMNAKGTKIDGLSCPDILGKTLEEEYKDSGVIKQVKPKTKKSLPPKNPTVELVNDNVCPDCGALLANSGGCVMCTCGWSKCL